MRCAERLGGLVCLAAFAFDTTYAQIPETIRPSQLDATTLRAQGAPETGRDRWHDRVFLGVQDFIARIDSRFVDEDKVALPVPVSPFRIGLETDAILRDGGSLEMRPRADLDLLLKVPNLERRLQLFITSDTVSESPLVHRASSAIRAGVRFGLLDYFDFDVGLQAELPSVAFASLRWQRAVSWDHWQLQPLAKLYVESGRGLGAVAGVSLERWWDHTVFRSSSYAGWHHDTGNTDYTQSFTLAHAKEVLRQGRYSDVVGGRDLARGFGLQLLATGTQETGAQRYEASLFLKRPTSTRWLYWSVAPLLTWERTQRWHPDPGIRLGIDALFWDVSRR
ncbi:MAG: hypothetical protein RLZZ200_1596 [Pseudomonadota bacterium]|jgi:hypothetical protein